MISEDNITMVKSSRDSPYWAYEILCGGFTVLNLKKMFNKRTKQYRVYDTIKHVLPTQLVQ